MNRRTVGIVFGGRSSEHSISCVTAGGVLSAIDRERYRPIPIGITAEGAFTLQPDDPQLWRMDSDALPTLTDNGTRIIWPDSASSRTLRVKDRDGELREIGELDIVFPILHGQWGEDGTIQGMLQLLGLPYVGNGVLASALAMDKHFTKTAAQAAGIPVAPWVSVTAEQWRLVEQGLRERVARLGLPLFVKPARAGSSVGVTKVTDLAMLEGALQTAWTEDSKALIETAMVGREIECAVLGGLGGALPRVSAPGEIVVRGREFYDFEAKYLAEDAAELICPVTLDADQSAELRDLAVRAFDALGCAGLARVDFFLTESGFVLNELNTMPGFTPISMFPKCWQASGLDYRELITELIELGISEVR